VPGLSGVLASWPVPVGLPMNSEGWFPGCLPGVHPHYLLYTLTI